MKIINQKHFSNGSVYALKTYFGNIIETTDTFLPYETISCDYSVPITKASRLDRWMIGVSVMSGCPVRCRFCATGKMKKWKNLMSSEIIDQVMFITKQNEKKYGFAEAKEHKINYTRMGEPFLNLANVKNAIPIIDTIYPRTHHFISTIGLKGSDFSWIEKNITLQISLHSFDEKRRAELIPIKNLMSIEELGQIRTKSKRKTTVNLSLVDKCDFNVDKLKKYFDPKYFFIKLSPINENSISKQNNMGKGVIYGKYN